jgi:phosphatidylglycerophosphate synthase
VREALARYPVPASLVVELASGEPAAGALDARAIYRQADLATDGAPEPIARLRRAADIAPAERALYAQIRKTVEGDGVFAHYLIRPLTRPLTRALLGTPVSPNQVTAVALACAIAAALLAAAGGARNAALAGLLYFAGNALDCVDGDLARLRLQSSRLGEWLDSMTDEIATFSLLAGLGVGLWRDGAGAGWLLVGVGGSAVGSLAVACLYVHLHRRGLPIDTAQFPWFFARPAEHRAPRTGAGAFVYGLGYLVRRDANVTGVTALLLLGWREVATALLAAGAAVGALITATHFAVMALRRARGP